MGPEIESMTWSYSNNFKIDHQMAQLGSVLNFTIIWHQFQEILKNYAPKNMLNMRIKKSYLSSTLRTCVLVHGGEVYYTLKGIHSLPPDNALFISVLHQSPIKA